LNAKVVEQYTFNRSKNKTIDYFVLGPMKQSIKISNQSAKI